MGKGGEKREFGGLALWLLGGRRPCSSPCYSRQIDLLTMKQLAYDIVLAYVVLHLNHRRYFSSTVTTDWILARLRNKQKDSF